MLNLIQTQLKKQSQFLKKMNMLSEAEEKAIKEATYITGQYDERRFV